MFEQVFNNVENILRNEKGTSTELDRVEQISWVLFLKYLDDLEQERSMEAGLKGKKYEAIIDQEHQWTTWAAPRKPDGSIDHNKARNSDDLIDYLDQELFPYLKGFKQRASSPDTIEYKIGEIFTEIENKFRNGYNLRGVLDELDKLTFGSQEEKHELSELYETRIKNMGNAGRNGGEYYTPRPLIRAMIQVVKPKLGETIYDPACGSAGFLCESYEYLRGDGTQTAKLTTKQLTTLQNSTLYGKEAAPLAYIIGIMNMILHGVDSPNILSTDTLLENLAEVQEKDRYDVILANPPFGAGVLKQTQQNFAIRTGESAYLFLQHFIKYLKAGGRAAIVIKNTFLSNGDNASVALRQELLEKCNLHTVLDCPGGTFLGAGVKTVVLFFDKGSPTKKIWYYQLDPGRNLGKTDPLNDGDLAEFVEMSATQSESDNSWLVDVADINKDTWDLTVNNPNRVEEVDHRTPQEIIAEIEELDAQASKALQAIKELL